MTTNPIPTIRPDAAIPVSPLGVALEMAEHGTAVTVALSDVAGAVLWEATGEAGVTRLHAAPPNELLGETVEIHVYLERLPMAGEAPEEPYLARLACGCLVHYTYRPALTAHCPTHATQRVHTVDYPTKEGL